MFQKSNMYAQLAITLIWLKFQHIVTNPAAGGNFSA
jgi:hypothetical protein